ncbi:HTH domain-containing protein [Daejeonella sp.]|uniref:HTH domain-containing protein n=1 Tax=Daejeonella sp. TaxID=2805397 RepID=UPI0039833890
MKLIDHIERINRLHELIRYRRTGTPRELARRLELSPSMVYKVLEELKLRGVPIEYSRQLKTYYYGRQYLMNIKIDFRLLNAEEIEKFQGGNLRCIKSNFA